MNIETNLDRLRKINGDSAIQNLIAQANARYILFNTSENRENFPAYTIQDGNLDILAFYYLEVGCSFAENFDLENAREPLERGSEILEYVHGSAFNRKDLSNFYTLIAALSYYVSFQYSKSFILIRKTESDTLISNLISLFLQRRFHQLSNEVGKIMIDRTFEDSYIALYDDEMEGADKIYAKTIAKSLDGFVKYFQSGEESFLKNARDSLYTLKEIAELKNEPSIWWVIRLLLLISEGFQEAALWKVLDKHFDIKSPVIIKYIKSLVYLSPRGIYELFITQRKSLSKVLNTENKGCVVTIPTSSGKTRIAEIAILDCFIKHPENKVLYIAPFRSLAFEIENALEKILSNVGITLSHLYGGNSFSRLDERIIEESNVIIATPEKAKAILRSNREIAAQIKLVIIDEGHLLGPDKRLVVNEIFYEELRYSIENNGGRFLVLSAVLPNPEDLALWLTKSRDTIYKDSWRPSDERLGIMDWNGERVNLNWVNNDVERPSFNNKFILREQLPLQPKQKKIRYIPGDKNEAVASTTYKLRNFGTALIFVGLKNSVFTMAGAYLKCLGNNPDDFEWSNKLDWQAYELACQETYGENNNWIIYARKGILCHHGALHVDVRLPLERLMRNDRPLVIISTSTLGQGVNLGVSTMIFSTLYQAGKLISARDFWNIAGRAGRAFIDHEAKILVAIDTSDGSSLFKHINKFKVALPFKYNRIKESIIKECNLTIREYFSKDKIDIASSGILILVDKLKRVADNANIEFDMLLQLISENKIDEIEEGAKEINETLDWIDDTLLAIQDLNNKSTNEIQLKWIEEFFRNSLAYIQIKNSDYLTKENFVDFMEARIKGIIQKVGTDSNTWKSIIQSGIPLNSNLFLESKLSNIVDLLNIFADIEKNTGTKIAIANSLIGIIKTIPVLEENLQELESNDFDTILSDWLQAKSFSSIMKYTLAEEIITNVFSYKLPWILNGLAKKLRNIGLEDEAELIEEISILIEIGLPNLKTVKIYQAGIRSRMHATEFSLLFDDELWEKSIRDYKIDIIIHKERYKASVSKKCGDWIDLLCQMSNTKIKAIDEISDFTFGNVHKHTNILIAKEIGGKQYLVSPDLSVIKDASAGDVDFSSVTGIEGVFFSYDLTDNLWKMNTDNPYFHISN